MKKLALEDVIIRPLREKIMVVTVAVAWNVQRHHPLVDAAVA